MRQRGGALLAVVVMLALVGALALAMSREGAMAASAIGADYDTAVARSLADAALNMAKWRGQRAGCKVAQDLVATTVAGVGTISAMVQKGSSKNLNVQATGVTTSGASVTLARGNVVIHDQANQTNKVVSTVSADSTWLSASLPDTPQGGNGVLELGQGSANILLRFALLDVPADSTIISAQLTLTQTEASAFGAPVSVRRAARGWSQQGASWNAAASGAPWSSTGGDYSTGAIASQPVGANGNYSWDVTALVDGWFLGLYPNYGFVIVADGPLQQARFQSFTGTAGSRPTLVVNYLPPC